MLKFSGKESNCKTVGALIFYFFLLKILSSYINISNPKSSYPCIDNTNTALVTATERSDIIPWSSPLTVVLFVIMLHRYRYIGRIDRRDVGQGDRVDPELLDRAMRLIQLQNLDRLYSYHTRPRYDSRCCSAPLSIFRDSTTVAFCIRCLHVPFCLYYACLCSIISFFEKKKTA